MISEVEMDVRYAADQIRYQTMTTEELRKSFLVENLFGKGKMTLLYTDVDRAIIGSAVPTDKTLDLKASKKEMAADYFAQRREIGVINIGDSGVVSIDGKDYNLSNRDGLYISGTSVLELKDRFGITDVELDPYLPLRPEIFEGKQLDVQYLGYYLPWHRDKVFRTRGDTSQVSQRGQG